MNMLQDARQIETLGYALFSQKAQKRTAVQHKVGFGCCFHSENHFISLPEITYCVRFMPKTHFSYFHSMLIAHVNGKGKPMYLPLYNVSSDGLVCFGKDIQCEGKPFRSLEEMAEYAVSTFWNSEFEDSYSIHRHSNYGEFPIKSFETWAEYTKLHPDWIPQPNAPLNRSDMWLRAFELQPELTPCK